MLSESSFFARCKAFEKPKKRIRQIVDKMRGGLQCAQIRMKAYIFSIIQQFLRVFVLLNVLRKEKTWKIINW